MVGVNKFITEISFDQIASPETSNRNEIYKYIILIIYPMDAIGFNR